jgi:hypothetical protein
MTVQCKLCGGDINPHDIASWKEVTGFVGGPKKDSMVLRKDTGSYACTPCIHKARDGQAPDQESLFEEPEETASQKFLREKQESEDAFDKGWDSSGIGDE